MNKFSGVSVIAAGFKVEVDTFPECEVAIEIEAEIDTGFVVEVLYATEKAEIE